MEEGEKCDTCGKIWSENMQERERERERESE
jgi:hypothetical protein